MNLTTSPVTSSVTSLLCGIELEPREFAAFQRLIYELAGISLSSSKHALVQSRLTKRLRALKLDSFAEYLLVIEDPRSPERELFINALTTNKTEFFREAHHFAFLRKRLFPELRERARVTGERRLRLWCAASSSGEEPYSLAMTIMEEFGDEAGWDIKVLATDIDTNMLERASAGLYDEMAVEYLPDYYRQKYLHAKADGGFAVNEALKRFIVFRKLNLNQPPWPIQTKFDAIFCRNVMIYFDQATQHRLVEGMTNLLSPGGYLIIKNTSIISSANT